MDNGKFFYHEDEVQKAIRLAWVKGGCVGAALMFGACVLLGLYL
jgi:hypothetical protein